MDGLVTGQISVFAQLDAIREAITQLREYAAGEPRRGAAPNWRAVVEADIRALNRQAAAILARVEQQEAGNGDPNG